MVVIAYAVRGAGARHHSCIPRDRFPEHDVAYEAKLSGIASLGVHRHAILTLCRG
jgi:hypothetical protein